jgi:hypothetical protein
MEVEVHVKTESPRVAHMRPDGYTLGIGLAGAPPPCRTWWQGQTDLGILDPTTSLARSRANVGSVRGPIGSHNWGTAFRRWPHMARASADGS